MPTGSSRRSSTAASSRCSCPPRPDPEQRGTAMELDFHRPAPVDNSQIPGWGIDADPKNHPTYPMKRPTDGEHAGYTWERPPQQPLPVEVLHSIERPNV